MSHLSSLASKLDDIEAIKDACKELGLTIREGGTVRYYYQQSNTKADYVISIPGCSYDVGLMKDTKTGTYNLVYDKFNGYVENKLGKNCSKLVQSATYHKLARGCKLKGCFISKKATDKGTLRVEILVQ